MRFKQPSVLPGFELTLGFTLSYLGLIWFPWRSSAKCHGRRARGLALPCLAPGPGGVPRQLRHGLRGRRA